MAVTVNTLAVALGQPAPVPSSPTAEQWTMWINDALMLIETRRVALNVTAIDAAKLDYVVREAVVAHIRRPDDATQVTIAVDDGSTSKSYRSGHGRVAIIDEWWALLGLTDPKGAFTLDMVPSGGVHAPWCSFLMGAVYCTCGADLAGYPIFGPPV